MFINNILSNVYVSQSWENLGTTSVSSRIEVVSVIYKKGVKKILQTTDPFISRCNNISISKYLLRNLK